MIDVSKYIRDPSKVHAALADVGPCTIAKKPVKIQVPKRYLDKQLAVIGQEYRIFAFYAMIVDDKYYAVSTTIGFLEIEPSNTNEVTINDETYLEFTFDVGARVFKTRAMLCDDKLCYRIYEEQFAQGHVPWYIGQVEAAASFDTAGFHAKAELATNRAIFEMIVSSRARSAKDRSVYWRHSIKQQSEFISNPPDLIQLRDVSYGASSTVAKMIGPYFKDSLVSAVVTPSTRVENIEEIYRR